MVVPACRFEGCHRSGDPDAVFRGRMRRAADGGDAGFHSLMISTHSQVYVFTELFSIDSTTSTLK